MPTNQEGAELKAWVVVNIGCIECGVSSNIVGVFTDKAEAERVTEELDDRMSLREGGQNAFEVFPMPPLNVVAEEYTRTGEKA